jgi:polyphosphate kinase 2
MPAKPPSHKHHRVEIDAHTALDDLAHYRLQIDDGDLDDPVLVGPDGARIETWRENYPYNERLDRADYEQGKRALQIELLKLQSWAQDTGQRIAVLFEGRDAAGKGGTIKRFMEHLNPRAARVVALDKPTHRENGQWYFQRYIAHLPTAGEIVLFDRSWYNRANVELVMGWVNDEKYRLFLQQVPVFERLLVDDGLHLVKLWFSVSRREQQTRFIIRRIDPVRQWKLSPTDLALLDRWDDYTKAREVMFDTTDTDYAPWTVIRSNDKRRARLEAMRLLLHQLPYPGKNKRVATKPDAKIAGPPWRIYERGEPKLSPPASRAIAPTRRQAG